MQPAPDYFRVTVTGSMIPAGSVGYRVPSALYDGTKTKHDALAEYQLVKMFPRDSERSSFLKNVVPGVTLDVIGILSRRNNELELSMRKLAGKAVDDGREYKDALHRYVAAYIDLNHASLGHPGEKAAVGVIGQFYDAADRLSRKKMKYAAALTYRTLTRC